MKTTEMQVVELFDRVRDAHQKAYMDAASKLDTAEREIFDFLKARGAGISDEAIAEAWKRRLNPFR